MKNNKMLAGVLAVVIVVAAIIYYVSTSSAGSWSASPVATTTASTAWPVAASAHTTSSANTTPKPPAPTPAVPPGRVEGYAPPSYLLSLTQPVSCSVTQTTGAKLSGTVYVSNGQLRGNFVGGTSMIDNGSHLYVWANGATTGLSLLAASSASGSQIANNGGLNPALPVNFVCNPWTVDGTVFTLPAGVTFSNTL